MKSLLHHLLPALLFSVLISHSSTAQFQVDTLAFQDFETVPAAPVWGYTGTLADVQSGFASVTSCIPNTPLGISGSQAWHVVQVSGGNPITFGNTVIPSGYDSVRVNFSLAGLNLIGSTGGPDNLDYVLVEYSLDNGATFVNRMRIRGSIQNNSFWAHDATGVAAVPYLPASEAIFQPLNSSGLQVAEGYSFCEISFPGTVSQIMIRITPRSSSSTDSWLIDNLVLTGESSCPQVTSSITETACGSYTSPSGNVYTSSGLFNDTIPAASGCDSIISIDLTVNPIASASITETACGLYTSPSGNVYTSSAVFNDTLTSVTGCDSIISIDLTVNPIATVSITETVCDSYTSPSGTLYTSSIIFNDTIASSAGCDSIITIDLTINASTTAAITEIALDTYTAPSGAIYTASGVYMDTIPNAAGCDSVITIDLTMSFTGLDEEQTSFLRISPNPARDFITLDVTNDAIAIEAVSIVDMSGSITEVTDFNGPIDVSNFAQGVYFIRVEHATGMEQLCFVKQ